MLSDEQFNLQWIRCVRKKLCISDEQFNLIWSRCVRNLRQCKYDTKANLSGWVILNFLVGHI